MTPTGSLSPLGSWPSQSNIVPLNLQLPGSRLKSALSARDMDMDAELFALDSHHCRQQLMDEISGLPSPSSWNNGLSTASAFAIFGDRTTELTRLGGVKPTNLEGIFGSLDPTILPQLQGLPGDATASQLQSPTEIRMRQNINQLLRSSYPTNFPSSPVRTPSFRIDSSGAAAAAVLNSRAAFANRSQSFIERSAVNRHTGFSSPTSSATILPSNLSDWGSPDGKLEWGMQGQGLDKLRKSASFGIRSNGSSLAVAAVSEPATVDKLDVSWVQSLVKDTPPQHSGHFSFEEQQQQCLINTGGSEMLPAWVEQLYIEQEQMVA